MSNGDSLEVTRCTFITSSSPHRYISQHLVEMYIYLILQSICISIYIYIFHNLHSRCTSISASILDIHLFTTFSLDVHFSQHIIYIYIYIYILERPVFYASITKSQPLVLMYIYHNFLSRCTSITISSLDVHLLQFPV